MPARPKRLTRFAEHREMLFWVLLLGSWQFLASPGKGASMIGAAGSACFLVFAWKSLGRLRGHGMRHACWKPAPAADWIIAVATGVVASVIVVAIASVCGQKITLSGDWRLVLLQVALGPVLEEVVFRGYLFAMLICSFQRLTNGAPPNWTVIVIGALAFALIHLAHPGVKWLQLACIASTGTLYGWIRCRSGSSAPAAASHAAYNLTLYVVAGIGAVGH